jgi:hypothetical protein
VSPQFEGVAGLQPSLSTRIRPTSQPSTLTSQLPNLLLTHFKNLIGSDTSKKLIEAAASKSLRTSRAAAPIRNAGVSLVIGIDQTNHSTNYD